MAIKQALLDELPAGRDPADLFAKDGLLDRGALGRRVQAGAIAMEDLSLRRRVQELTWTCGSGRATSGEAGYVFGVRVGDDSNAHYRWVPHNPW